MTKWEIIDRYGEEFFKKLSERHDPYFDYDRREEYWMAWQIENTLKNDPKGKEERWIILN